LGSSKLLISSLLITMVNY